VWEEEEEERGGGSGNFSQAPLGDMWPIVLVFGGGKEPRWAGPGGTPFFFVRVQEGRVIVVLCFIEN
jgi:hypothetical protein